MNVVLLELSSKQLTAKILQRKTSVSAGRILRGKQDNSGQEAIRQKRVALDTIPISCVIPCFTITAI